MLLKMRGDWWGECWGMFVLTPQLYLMTQKLKSPQSRDHVAAGPEFCLGSVLMSLGCIGPHPALAWSSPWSWPQNPGCPLQRGLKSAPPHPSCRVLAGTLGFLVCAQDVGASECCPEGRPNHPVLPFSHRGDLHYLYTQCGLLDVFQTETASASQETLRSILPWM